MEDELQFLVEGDENIFSAELVELHDKNGKETVGISIVVGDSEEELSRIYSNLKEGETPNTKQYEILLTKKDIQKLSKLLKEF